MTNSKTTKRALFSSVLALALCFTMLIGTTFAWFTDSASTGVNRIVAGKLKIALEVATAWDSEGNPTEWEDARNQSLNFRTADNRTEKILWEPGCTYALPELRIRNDGNLALKYKIAITGIQGNAELNEVIDWTIANSSTVTELSANHSLAVGESNILTIQGHMDEDADNYYMDKYIDGISITVYATQDTVEHDGVDNTYDKDALYMLPVAVKRHNAYEYYGADTDEVLKDFTIGHRFDDEADGKVIYVYEKAKLTLDNVDFDATIGDVDKRQLGMFVYSGATLTINSGDYNISGRQGYLIWVQNKEGEPESNVVINDGTFTSDGTYNALIAAYNGTVTINGGFFNNKNLPRSTLNTWNGRGGGKIIVNGGTFVNYDPSYYAAEGCSVTAETQSNGDVWYTVKSPIRVSSVSELTHAIAAASNDGQKIVLTEDFFKTNNHCLWNGKVELDLNGHTVTGVGLTTEDEYAGNRATPIFLTDVQWWTGATEGGELVINGEGTIKSCDTAVRASNGTKITINGGEFIATYAANGIVDANEGAVVVITGGSFKQIQGSYDYTLRTGSNEETRGTIIVKGGSFYKYDPSAEHPYDTGVSVADGYKVVQDGDWYRVVPE